MTDTDMTAASLELRADQARVDAIRALCDLAHDDPDHYPAQLLLSRSAAVEVLVREALHTCHRPATSGPLHTCGVCARPSGGDPDLDRAAHIADLAQVALGRSMAVMDVVADGRLPEPAADDTPTVADLAAALTAWGNQ